MKKKRLKKVKKNKYKKITIVASGSIFLLVILYFSFKAVSVQAEIATFYPNSCLGGWTNSFRAAGKPDVLDENTNSISNENSALLPENTNAEIYCGDFKGTIPENTAPKKLIVTFSWDIAKNNGEGPQNISSDSFKSSAGEILDATSGKDVNFTLGTSSLEASSTGNASNIEPVQSQNNSNVVSPPDNISTSSLPTSFLNLFTTTAFAEEIASSTTEIVTDATSTISTTSDQIIPSISIDSTNVSSGNEILEVFYTLDGKDWESLGRVDAVHLRYSIFEIPIPPETSWNDLSGLQISVRSLQSIDRSPAVFLDGMTLQVSYGKADTSPFVSKSGLYVASAKTSSPSFSFKVRNNDGIQEVVVKSDGDIGNLAIFNTETGVLEADTFAGANSYVIQPESYGEGSHTFIKTSDPDSCSSLSFIACKMAALGDDGEIIFTRGDVKKDSGTSTVSNVNSTESSTTIDVGNSEKNSTTSTTSEISN